MGAHSQLLVIAIVVALIGFSLPALAQERDADGARMQARQVDVGTVHSERLTPPQDEADWRMIKLEEESSLELKLTVESSNRSAKLTLAGATGNELAAKSAGERAATITQSLDAGIYYIAVESGQSLSYELRID